MFRNKIVPVIFILIFLAPVAGKSFHHHDHQVFFPAPGAQVIGSICPVCQYEICSFDLQTEHEPGQYLIIQDIMPVSIYEDPKAPGISLPFLLRAPPRD